MRLSLYITAAPEQESAFRAWQFAEAAVAAGHQLERIFFAGAGAAAAATVVGSSIVFITEVIVQP